MMNIQIRLFAALAKFLPEEAMGKQTSLSVPEKITIRSVLEQLDIPTKMAKLIMVNGVHRRLDYVLQAGDSLSVFPPIAGG
ncbi:MAG: MoaD/ThiS family protein [Planctomycetota bacterium]